MSLTMVILLNAVLDCSVIAVLAYVMFIPFRLRDAPADSVPVLSDRRLDRRAA